MIWQLYGLHPDGSRVQQSSLNRRTRTAPSNSPDTRGNWIARDAGGKAGHKEDGELINIRFLMSRGQGKEGKERAIEGNEEDDRTGRNWRARKRRNNSSSSLSSSSDSDSASGEIKIQFPDPSPELLKCIHHFASRYYQEKGVLSDLSRGYRDERKTQRSKSSASNIHDQTTRKPALWTRDSSLDADDDDQWEDEKDELEDEGDEWEDEEDDGENASHNEEHKDMYKALDGSALVAIGIILQEQIAHAMITGFSGTRAGARVRPRDYSVEQSPSPPSLDSESD
ncbi:uncharacterized protein EDB93DRAFT_1166012 [Suillus bovinus]|uniref:uncharacterized protein n=1 Tax=Suillus bovinus TaxID=48563 RepID=UPI001B8620C7|nr:uncharacterized protein EDB93DRAFT_1166012 [Suillus bovinus]KAG2138084.1 hypothetical protein EDB93DRAFT_1166012 [Suillus bovinus]